MYPLGVSANTDHQEILAPGGRFYLVAVQQNKPLAIIEYMKSLGLSAEVSPPT